MNKRDELYNKLSAEYDAFIEGLKSLPPDKIIQSAYEKVFKEDILMCFEGDAFYDTDIAILLTLDAPLEAMYQHWLNTDVTYMEDLRETISYFAEQESERLTAQGLNGKLRVGDWVVSTPQDTYCYLVGQIIDIVKLGTPEHAEETDNNYDSVHVDFTLLELPSERIAEIEAQFSDLYGQPKAYGELPLDDTIMPPDALLRITELEHVEIARMANSRHNCEAFCACFPETMVRDEREALLIARLNGNLAAYKASLMDFGKHELIEMASVAAAMSDTHYYLTANHRLEANEVEYLLQFQNPLEVVADAWQQRTEDLSDMGFALDEVLNKRETLLALYPLVEPDSMPDLRREIIFRDEHYRESFRIKDGDSIKITAGYDGEVMVRKCRFLDDAHMNVGSTCYHMDEFVGKMARVGNTYEPVPGQEPMLDVVLVVPGDLPKDITLPLKRSALHEALGGEMTVIQQDKDFAYLQGVNGNGSIIVCGMKGGQPTSLHPYSAQMRKRELMEKQTDKKASITDRLAAGKEKAETYKAQNPVGNKNKEDLSK